MPPRRLVESNEIEEDEHAGQDFPLESDPPRTPLDQPLGTPFMRESQEDSAPGARTARRLNWNRSTRIKSERSEPESIPDETEPDPADDQHYPIHDTQL
jgi:hypothetical protein